MNSRATPLCFAAVYINDKHGDRVSYMLDIAL